MEKRNYNLEMLKTVAGFPAEYRPKLLLQCCCGPCTTAVIERLLPYFDLTLFYYNPNTRPYAEYVRRLDTLKEYLKKASLDIPLLEGEYDEKLYDDSVKGFSDTAEGGARCAACINLRLDKTAETAQKLGFNYFASTLSVSPLKNADVINTTGLRLSEKYGVKYLVNDFKKDNGGKRSVELSKKYNLYRQDYCGCEMSARTKEKD